jgi:hypothetical protein
MATQTDLYDALLPILQELSTYGGNFTSFHISRPVLEAVDAGAAVGDPFLEACRRKLLDTMGNFKGLQDHQTFSALFEAFHEAVFYLVAGRRGVTLRVIAASGKYGKTPDFATTTVPTVRFEVKTIDVSDPLRTYDKTMAEGLDARLEAEAAAQAGSGVGIVARGIAPHGIAEDRRQAVEQVMKKIDSNVKYDQYSGCPTFLVVSTSRTSLHYRAGNLRKRVKLSIYPTLASGQLFAVAAHSVGDDFYFVPEHKFNDILDLKLFPEAGEDVVSLGPLNRNGVLLDHPFIAGLIFLCTEWSKINAPNALDDAYYLHGVWNLNWENRGVSREDIAAAKQVWGRLCHSYNDTNDARSALLPER